jgi:hypothetical protein
MRAILVIGWANLEIPRAALSVPSFGPKADHTVGNMISRWKCHIGTIKRRK